MTLQLFHSKFPYIRGKLDFLFYQCTWFVVVYINSGVISELEKLMMGLKRLFKELVQQIVQLFFSEPFTSAKLFLSYTMINV